MNKVKHPRILLVHNRYRLKGGEDTVVAAEAALLESRGHSVNQLIFDNSEIPDHRSPLISARFGAATIWSRHAAAAVRETVRSFRPDVVHFHNTFPLISPSAYYAVRAEGVPVVQTLHNYRTLCPNALFFREGRVCEDCLGKRVAWPGIVHACYRRSRGQTLVTASMLAIHRLIGSWTRTVDAYIALTEFSRRKFIQGGLPAERIVVKPNFVFPDTGPGEHDGGYALFVGRLSPEKGIEMLLQAWERIPNGVPLRIVGDGSQRECVVQAAERSPGIAWFGQRPASEVFGMIRNAQVLVLPSVWYEGFPMVMVEAFAAGTPVMGAKIGAMTELIEDGRTGILFTPGDADDLAAKVTCAWAHPEELAMMGKEARREYEAKYTAERNYAMLMEIYDRAVSRARER